MSVLDHDIKALDGSPDGLAAARGRLALLVNVASQCGLTPQYAGLERLQQTYADRGFTVVGLPCNQFLGQEPGTAEEIADFCSTNYGITFPLTEKIEVNGPHRHPVYAELVRTPDSEGTDGDVAWNFEKFLVGRDGQVLARFRPPVEPESAEVVAAIEAHLAS